MNLKPSNGASTAIGVTGLPGNTVVATLLHLLETLVEHSSGCWSLKSTHAVLQVTCGASGRFSTQKSQTHLVVSVTQVTYPIRVFAPISGGVTHTEMFPSLSEEDADVSSTGSTCRGVNRPLPSGPHLPVSRSRLST